MNNYSELTPEINYEYLANFRLGNLLFGINVASALEVLEYQEPKPFFYRSKEEKEFIIGIIKYRSMIIPVVSLHATLGLPEIDNLNKAFFYVVSTPECKFSLLVNEVGDVIKVDRNHFEDVPATISNRIKAILKGVYRIKNSLILVTSPKDILSVFKQHLPN
jgi:purine-binding chemotaxis protein CheW